GAARRGRPAGVRQAAGTHASEDVTAQVLVLDDALEPFADVRGADDDAAFATLGELEEDVLEQRGHDGVQAARADVLEALVDLGGDASDLLDAVVGELEGDAFRGDQRLVLPQQRVLGLAEDADEVALRERAQLDADGEAPLELGHEVARLRDVERARGDEQDVLRAHEPVLGRDGAALDDGEQVALHALAADVGADATAVARDLVDLVQEDDAALLGALERLVDHLIHVDELVQLVLEQDAAGLRDADGAALLPLGHHLLEHLGEVEVHALHPTDVEHHVLDGRSLLDLDVDEALLELAVPQQGPELLAGALAALLDALPFRIVRRGQIGELALLDLAGRADDEGAADGALRLGSRTGVGRCGPPDLGDGREEEVEEAFLDALLGDLLDLGLPLLADHVDRDVHEVADHGLDVAADVADLGELRCFDLDERRAGEPGEAAGDLGLPDAGGADHDNVVGHDLFAQLVLDALPAPAVAQRDGDRLLGGVLAHDVLVQLRDDLARRQLVEPVAVPLLLRVLRPRLTLLQHTGHRSVLQLQHGDVLVGVDADVRRDLERTAHDVRGGEVRVGLERAGRCEREGAAAADGDDLVVRLDDVAVAADEEDVAAVRDGEQGLEAPQVAVGTPVLGQLDAGAREVGRVALELLLELVEQGQAVRDGAGEAGQDAAVPELADLLGAALHDGVAHGDLAVAAERDTVAVAQ